MAGGGGQLQSARLAATMAGMDITFGVLALLAAGIFAVVVLVFIIGAVLTIRRK
jgi:hypothetical protein